MLAVLVGLPIVLANCGSDSSDGGSAGAPPAVAGSPGTAGTAAAGTPGVAGSPAVGGGGSTSVGGGGATSAGGGGSTSVGGSGGASAGSGGASAGAGGSGGKAGSGAGGGSGGGTTGGTFTLTSTEIAGGMTIPEAHTCDGKGGFMDWGVAPSFKWSNPPAGTMSYAFFMIDWTLTMGASPTDNGYHSAAWNIATTVTQLPKGWGATDVGSAKVINGGYLGPCPPSGTDTYHMIVMALPMATYTISGSGVTAVKAAYNQLKGVALATAELTGTYKKK